ncbi:hypothetical protein I79_013336 [Cricetulus griseus]|uniref:Uncharacterized protein n=1 Tax=Cricetulus griseus TaxID=10029 RepID=G3HR73_CRIGR|nr:hypothetical protein I79_013336 [Cricetulus griseus]
MIYEVKFISQAFLGRGAVQTQRGRIKWRNYPQDPLLRYLPLFCYLPSSLLTWYPRRGQSYHQQYSNTDAGGDMALSPLVQSFSK